MVALIVRGILWAAAADISSDVLMARSATCTILGMIILMCLGIIRP